MRSRTPRKVLRLAPPACCLVLCAVLSPPSVQRERDRHREVQRPSPPPTQLTAGWGDRHTRAGVIKPVNATKMRRRKEKAERIKAALEEEAEARRQARKSVLAKRERDGAKATVRALPH